MAEEKRLNVEKSFPGLTCFSDGLKVVPIESVPGVLDAGWSPSDRVTRNNRFIKETTNELVLFEALKKVLNFVSKKNVTMIVFFCY